MKSTSADDCDAIVGPFIVTSTWDDVVDDTGGHW